MIDVDSEPGSWARALRHREQIEQASRHLEAERLRREVESVPVHGSEVTHVTR